jgi:hypothetical protein
VGTLLVTRRTLAALMLRMAALVGRIEGGRGGGVIKPFRLFPHDATTDETFECAEFAMIFVRDKTDGITDGMGAAGAPDAMNIIF